MTLPQRTRKLSIPEVFSLLPYSKEFNVEAFASTILWDEEVFRAFLNGWQREKKLKFKSLSPSTIIIIKPNEDFPEMKEERKPNPPSPSIQLPALIPKEFPLTLPPEQVQSTTSLLPPPSLKQKLQTFALTFIALSISAVDITINSYFGLHQTPNLMAASLVTIGGTGFDLGKTFLLPKAIQHFQSFSLIRGALIFFGWFLCLLYGILICWNFAANNLATKTSSNEQVVQNIQTKKNELKELERKLNLFSQETDPKKIKENEKLVSSWTSRRSVLSLEIRNEEKFLTSSNPSAELTALNFNWLFRKELFARLDIENSQLWLFVVLINILPSILLLSLSQRKSPP